MSTAEATQEATLVEATPITDPALLVGSFSSTSYVSDWRSDTNSTNHNIVFEHKLGKVPSAVSVLFSLDLQTVYPIQWSWSSGESGNPVSVWMDAKTITLSITYGTCLHGWWNGVTNSWSKAYSGYWRVIASTKPDLQG